jgi:hypothetical protein
MGRPIRSSTIAFVPPSHVPRKGSVLPEIYIYPLYPYYYIKYIYINKKGGQGNTRNNLGITGLICPPLAFLTGNNPFDRSSAVFPLGVNASWNMKAV